MPVYSRSLLLFAILSAAALLTWVLARNTEREPESPPGNASDVPQGSSMQGAVLYATDENGQVPYRIHAESIEQVSTAHDTTLVEVRVEYSEQSETAWEITAARGTMTPDRELLDLQSVRLTASTAQGRRFVFESRELSLDLVARTASTRQAVQLRTDECESNARGLDVDLNRDTYELRESVTTCRPRATPVLGLALLAGVAVAQEEPVTETRTIECYPPGGSFITNEHTCKDGIISVGQSLRLTFGLGTLHDERGVVVEGGEWNLTGGIRLEYETAVLVADSASFTFDADSMVSSFELVGDPAEMSDYVEGRSAPVRFTAQTITYDRASGIMTMGQVRFAEDGEQASTGEACALTYRFETKEYVLGTEECGFRATLTPPAAEDSSTESPDEP